MLDSVDAVEVIARCGGYYKPSFIAPFIDPVALRQYLLRRKEHMILTKKFRCKGEYTYILPAKYVSPYWRYIPFKANTFEIYRSLALLHLYGEKRLLPYTKALKRQHFPHIPERFYNGVYPSIKDGIKYCIIVDFYRSEKKLIEIIEKFKALERGLIVIVSPHSEHAKVKQYFEGYRIDIIVCEKLNEITGG